MLAPMPKEGDLVELLQQRRVVVCAGAGGVGKTTMSAALATLSASLGKRTLCLTIDPARRLAQAFGLQDFSGSELEISARVFGGTKLDARPGVASPGTLTVMMLDPRETFDEIVQAGLGTADQGRRVLSMRVYDHLAKDLAGTQAYMAMEKVCAIMNDPRWDLIVLDTPPSAKVLDFFDAPTRMEEILDSPATRALISVLRGGQRMRPGLLGAGMRAALVGMERVTGSSLLVEMAELISSMNQLLGGFGERARRVKQAMRSEGFAYVLVTSPDAMVVEDVAELARAMSERNLKLDALICNRVSLGGAQLSREKATDLLTNSMAILSDAGVDQLLAQRLVDASLHEDQRRSRQVALCDQLVRRLVSDHPQLIERVVGELPAEEGQTIVAFSQALGGACAS